MENEGENGLLAVLALDLGEPRSAGTGGDREQVEWCGKGEGEEVVAGSHALGGLS